MTIYRTVGITFYVLACACGCTDEGQIQWKSTGRNEATSVTSNTLSPSRTPTAAIMTPADRSEVKASTIEVQGLVCNLPETAELFVFVEDQFLFYEQFPPARVDRRTDRFIQRNTKIATPGIWRIHVVAVTGAARKTLHSRARHSQWEGMPTLPPGCDILDTAEVEKPE